MLHLNKTPFIALCSSILFGLGASTAMAQPMVTDTAPPPAEDEHHIIDDFGARVGGYGFRSQNAAGESAWDDCRMNGLGVFVTRNWSEHLFSEAGADIYFSDTFPAPEGATAGGMDRISGLFSVAAGLRVFPGSLISGNAHAGVALETTRITLGGATGSFVRPVGFVGVGGDIELWDGLRFGMSLRTLVMAHPIHDHAAHHHDMATAGTEGAAPTVEVEPEIAAQGQFYLKYSL